MIETDRESPDLKPDSPAIRPSFLRLPHLWREVVLGRVVPILYTAAGIMLFYQALTEVGAISGVQQRINNLLNPPPSEPVIPNRGELYSYILRARFQSTLEKSINTFKSWQVYGQINLQSLLSERQPQQVIQLLGEMQRDSLIQGADILKTAWLLGYTEDRIATSPNLTYVWINQRPYDLRHRFHLQLANSWVYAKMEYLDQQLKLTSKELPPLQEEVGFISYQMELFKEEAELLEWLRDLNPNITLTEDSFAFFPQHEMVNMARTFKAVIDQGSSLPGKIGWCGPRCLERKGAQGVAYPGLNTVELDNQVSAKTVAHEVAHLVGVYKLFLLEFTKIRQTIGQDSEEHRLRYVSSYAMTNPWEDFAETFAHYLMEGEEFRMKLDQLRLYRPADYQILKDKYNFLKDVVFKGVEFSSLARKIEPAQAVKEQAFSGLRWVPDKKVLEVQPDPNALPNRRYDAKIIPVFMDGFFHAVFITYQYFPDDDAYQITISGAKLLSKVTLKPLVGNEGGRFGIAYSRVKLEVVDDKIEIDTSMIKDNYALGVWIKSPSKVEVGQQRHPKLGAALIIDPDPGPYSRLIHLDNTYELFITEGPKEWKDPQTGELIQYWRVEAVKTKEPDQGTKQVGWLAENLIGKNLTKN